MMGRVELTLPFPISTNHMYQRTGKRKGRTDRYNAFIAEVIMCCIGIEGFGPDVRLATQMTFYRGDKRQYDIDNFIKPVHDALAHAGMYPSDSQIDKSCQQRGEVDKANPRCEVIISIIEEPHAPNLE